MVDASAVLSANAAFYGAFRAADLAAMEAVWAGALQVTCIHPSGPPLVGRRLVMRSWASILGGRGAIDIACGEPSARLYGEVAIVLCYEAIAGQTLAATNVFGREDGDWRMVHHQAGPMPVRQGTEPRARVVH